MAHTAAGALLTEQHRRLQLALDEATRADLARLWPTFDPTDIDGSWARLESAISALVQARRRTSSGLAAGYFQDLRRVETSTTTAPSIVLADVISPVDLTSSLTFTGPIIAKKLISTGSTDVASETFDYTAGNVTRLVLNGGRETITASVQADRRTLGYARVTDGTPCAFCAMLAGRGAVYGPDSAAFSAHRKCGCTAEPVFSEDPVLPGRAGEFQSLWTESTKGLSGKPAAQAFRRAYEGR